MFKKKSIVLGIVLAVVMLVGVTGCTAADIQSIQGIIKDVDSVSGNVTVTLNDGTTRTFNFNDVTMETIKQALGDLRLECGDNVTIDENWHHEVKRMRVHRAEVGGTIKSLGSGNSTITITTNKQGEITLNITANTTIRIQGMVTAALSDLQIGQKVAVKYDIATMNALRINVNTGWDWENHGKNKLQEREHGNNRLHEQERPGNRSDKPELSVFSGQQV
jgi:hypothetical protein